MSPPSRREFLRGAAVLALPAVGGCLDSGPPGTDRSSPETDDTIERSQTATRTPTAQPGTEPSPEGDDVTDTDASTPTEEPETETERAAGPVAWCRTADAAVTATPVLSDGRAYAGTTDGTVRRHDAASGRVEWAVDLGAPVQDLVHVDETLLVVSGTNEFNADQTLHALAVRSGAEQWTASPEHWWLELLGVGDGTVYVATADDALRPTGETMYALSLADGATRWSTTVGDPREGILTSDAVYVSVFGRIYAFDRESGQQRWARAVDDVTYTTPAVVDGTMVYATDEYHDDRAGVLVGVDASTGEERWHFDGLSVTSAVAHDGTLYVGGGGVAAVDPTDGTAVWQTETSGFVTAAGVTTHLVYTGGDGVQAYDRAGGDRIWEWTPDPGQSGVFPAGLAADRILVDAYHDAHPRTQYKFAVRTDGTGAWAFEDGTELTDVAVGSEVAVVGGKYGVVYGLTPSVEG